jgi:hypothetical protein
MVMPADFGSRKVLIDWKDAQGFTTADPQTGVAVFGPTASGKTAALQAQRAKDLLQNSGASIV